MEVNHRLDFIVKLGGSAVTHKDTFETAKLDEIELAAELLRECWEAQLSFVVVHGAGSFGHHQAHEYNINGGIANSRSKESQARARVGFSLTRLSVTKLNHMITSALVKRGLPAVALSPCGSWKTNKTEVVSDGVTMVSDLLAAGYIPVTHGDCVLDQAQQCAILSGDTAIKVLSERLLPLRVVFLSDVNGVYTKPPSQPGSQLIARIEVDSDGMPDLSVVTSSKNFDVTGGIMKKIDTASKIVALCKGGTRVFICNVDPAAATSIVMNAHITEHRGTEFTSKGCS